jgi:hypothetical protein
MILVQVNWPGAGQRFYADRDYGVWKGRVINFSGIVSEKTRDSSGNVSQCNIILDDFDSEIKVIVDLVSTEGAEAYIYHQYKDGSQNELFRGRVTNLTWDEGQRQASFEVVSVIESLQVGFMATEDDTLDPNNEVAIGKQWPLVFGKVAHVPAVLAQTCPRGKLQDAIHLTPTLSKIYQMVGGGTSTTDYPKGVELLKETDVARIVDAPMVEGSVEVTELKKFRVKESKRFRHNTDIILSIGGVLFGGKFLISDNTHADYDVFTVAMPNLPKFYDVLFAARQVGKDYDNPKVAWLKDSNIDLSGCYVYVKYTQTYRDPETHTVKSREMIDENICVRQEGLKCWFKYPFKMKTCPGALESEINPEWGLPTQNSSLVAVYNIARNGMVIEIEAFVNEMKERLEGLRKDIRTNEAGIKSPYSPLLRQLDMMQFVKNAFWSAHAGSLVIEWVPVTGDIYVANATESDEVHAVHALRTMPNGEQVLTAVPKSFYTVNTSRNVNVEEPFNCTTIEFNRPLDSYDLNFDASEIFVTLTSSVGSNTANIIRWLIETYTGYDVDEISFDAVEAMVEQYPSNFAYFNNVDALSLIKEIAWQARCAIITDNEFVKIRYLSAVPVTQGLITESNVEFGNLELSTTPVDFIYTQLKANYQTSYDPTVVFPLRLIYSNNIDLYGLREQEVDFYIYNHPALIRKSMQFWGVRLSNSWRFLRLKSFTNLMNLEVFDAVTATFFTGIVPGSNTLGTIEATRFDPVNTSVDLTVWLSAIAGTTNQHAYAWLDEGLDEEYVNEADKYTETDVCLFYTIDKLDINETMREFRKMEMGSYSLGKIVGVDSVRPTRKRVLVYNRGPFRPPQPVKYVWMWDTTPHHDLKIGDWVQCQSGQDGIDYTTKYELPVHLAKVVSYGAGKYTLELVRPYDGPNNVWPWRVEENARGSEASAPAETIEAYNLAEIGKENAGELEPDTLVAVHHAANDTQTDNDPGFWWFSSGGSGGGTTHFYGRVVSATLVPGHNAKWKYTLTKIDKDGWLEDGASVDLVGEHAQTFTNCYNIWEANNPSVGYGAMGCGMYISSAQFAADEKMLPVVVNTIVEVRITTDCNDVVRWNFTGMNRPPECS